MSVYARPEENTLGVPISHRPRGRAGRAPIVWRAPRLERFSIPRASLGTSYLALGATVVVAISAVYGFGWFVVNLPTYPRPVLAVTAWVVLVSVGLGAAIAVRVTGDRMEDWTFAWFLFGLAGAVVLDLVAIWGMGDIGGHATSSIVAGTALLLVLVRRGPVEIAAAAGALGATIAVCIAVETRPTLAELPDQVAVVVACVLPALIGVAVITNFRRMVQRELDRVLVQSTVSAPRFAVGMLASEELARLDLEAERLLDEVADGKVALPLDAGTASTAASLATELRLHLLEGRRETWLYHAITESDMLGKSVTLRDPNSLAGLLDPAQRDGLLSAIWMLVSDTATTGQSRTIQVVLGPLDLDASTPDKLCVPIDLTTTGIGRSRVDRSVWDALDKVGDHTDTTENLSVRVVIDALVDRPRDVERSRS